MANISTNTREQLISKRDKNVRTHLEQYAPVWLVDEKVILEDEAVQFNVVFLHPHGSLNGKPVWVNRRYRYDGFNDTLYHMGQTTLGEEDVIELSEKEPYVTVTVTDNPNAYGG